MQEVKIEEKKINLRVPQWGVGQILTLSGD